MSCCVNAHALLSAVVARLAAGGETNEKELAAILGSGCTRADMEAALSRSDAAPFLRARESLSRIP